LTPTLQIFRGISKVPSQPSLLQAKQAQLPQPLLGGEMLQSPHHPRNPELDTVLQMGPHWGRVEGGGDPPSTCWSYSSECTPGDHWPSWQPGHTAGSWSTCHPPAFPGPSLQSCSPAGQPQPVLVHGVVPPQVQAPALAL